MTHKIENGTRVTIHADGRPVQAGMNVINDEIQLAYMPETGWRHKVGASLVVEDTSYKITGVWQSELVPQMVVLTLEELS